MVLLAFVVWGAALSLIATRSEAAQSVSGTLVIMTSFPPALFEKYQAAFERAHPGVRVFVRNKKTSAAISFIEERPNEAVDIFWASSPDAFDILKESGHLLRLDDDARREVRRIGSYPVDDPDGYYKGFALSGYGIVWNPPYLERTGLPVPRSWSDLKHPRYEGHIGISAPSRSGTTHLIVENILQQQGWQHGWATLFEIGGNLATITARSYGVLEGIKAERFGIGVSIDFLGLSPKALGEPVDFAYAPGTALLPASIAIVKQAANEAAARAFVAFVLSEPGQKMLFHPEVSRLPISPTVYGTAPTTTGNPFAGDLVENSMAFDTQLSRQRYHLVNLMFDTLITFRLSTLKRSWSAIHAAERALATRNRPDLADKIAAARTLMEAVPVSADQAHDAGFSEIFERPKPGLTVPAAQLDHDVAWATFARKHHEQALKIATVVLQALSGAPENSP